MTEATAPAPSDGQPRRGLSEDGGSAGARLKAAREARGLHVVNLAVTLKVPPRKIEALEADRWSEVGDAVFVRALAQAVCRQLGADAQPVLERLPKLERDPVLRFADSPVTGRAPQETGMVRRPGLPASGGGAPGLDARRRNPAALAAALSLAAAAALYFWTGNAPQAPAVPTVGAVATAPEGSASGAPASGAPVSLVAAPSDSVSSSAPVAPAVPGTPAPAVNAPAPALPAAVAPSPAASGSAPSASSTALASSTAPLVISALADSWVELRDARGELLLSRIVRSGERVELPALLPAQVVIGNAAGTQLTLRGQPVDLAAATRDNVTRIELR